MRTLTPEELKKILNDHKLWLNDNPKGARADLRFADLRSADLSSANLRFADLRSADLRSADLSSADLRFADLRFADLRSADLLSADLSSADLRSADLSSADLSSADLRFADLSSADLRSADLSSADLRFADLRSADLSSADLRSADLSHANLSFANLRVANLCHQICPEIGSFTAFKKVNLKDGDYKSEAILILEIPADAKRANAVNSRKCRAEKALVIKAEDTSGALISETAILYSSYDSKFIYKINSVAMVEDFNENITAECGKGISFFITRKEAEEYKL